MVGLSAGNSWTHSSPSLMHLITRELLHESPNDGSTSSRILCSSHNLHACNIQYQIATVHMSVRTPEEEEEEVLSEYLRIPKGQSIHRRRRRRWDSSYSSYHSKSLKPRRRSWRHPISRRIFLPWHTQETCIHCTLALIDEILQKTRHRAMIDVTYIVPTTLFVVSWIWSPPKMRAIPKSEIFGLNCSSSRMLLVFRSLWIILNRESRWR